MFAALRVLCILGLIEYIYVSAADISNLDGDTFTDQFVSEARDSFTLASEASLFCGRFYETSPDCQSIVYNKYSAKFKLQPSWAQRHILLSHFSQELVTTECNTRLKGAFDNITDCIDQVGKAVRTSKMVEAFLTSYKLKDIVNANKLVPMKVGWDDDIEGHTFYYLDKLRILQDLIDDSRVESICEVGFNLGHSAINSLTANPTASFLAFDVVQHDYSAAAINALRELFPHRIINLMVGDSATSVPNFVRMFSPTATSGIKCNIIFIDGGHGYDSALQDIQNFASLANHTYHKVVIDDGLYPDVKKAWIHARDTLKIVKELEVIEVVDTMCQQNVPYATGPLAGSPQFVSCSVEDPSDYGRDEIFVGEYPV